jgi:hypothetical protein
MPPMKARVHQGRLRLDEATDLPEGSEIELVPADWWDDLDDDSRRRLEETLAQSERDIVAGRLIPAETVLRKLRRKA